MEEGLCLAGVPEDSCDWIRPVRPALHVTREDLIASDGRILSPLDLVELNLVQHKPDPPHVEDWITNFNRMPTIVTRPSDDEREAVLERASEGSIDTVIGRRERSLVLIEPDKVVWTLFDPVTYGRYRVRLSFSLGGRQYVGAPEDPGYPCTDLKFRAWGRQFVERTTLDGDQLSGALGARRIFLAIGLTRLFEGSHWPLIVGVHTIPDYTATIDLANP